MHYIKYVLVVFLLGGCSSFLGEAKGDKKEYTKTEYEIIKQREEFISKSNAFLIHTMKKDVLSNYINLPTLSKQMIFIIPVGKFLDRVHYVINSENNKINIKYHLISGLEYFYDKVNKELLIIYNLPFSYFLENNVVFNTEIVGSLNGEIVKKDIIFDWTYNFMEKAVYLNKKTNNPSFLQTSFDDKNINNQIKEILRKESKQINIKRFSKKYQKLYTKILNK